MRRLIGWIGGAAGGITAYRFFRRRRTAAVEAEPDARAEELRERLAESRAEEAAAEPAAEEPAAGEPDEPDAATAEAEPEGSESPDERRRRVHEEGRAAIDEMKSD
jgi:hypothetical protein